MTEEKNLNASKQPDNSQNKFADELLSDDELDKIAGGTGDTSKIGLFDEPLKHQVFVGGK